MFLPKASVKVLFIFQAICLWNLGQACNVPVFRYALERWEPDLYYAVVVHGPDGLDESGQSAFNTLKECSLSGYGVINLDVYQYSNSVLNDSQFAPLFKESGIENAEPMIYLFHPDSAKESGAVWSAPLTEANVHRLLADTDRLHLLNKVTSGVSVIMLMLESGNPELDEQAWQNLNTAVGIVSEYIAMPEGIELYDGTIIGDGYSPGDPDNKLWSSIPLKLQIDLQRISRTDENIVLVNSLLSIDPSIRQSTDSPMVFPVFGRGRFLFPMIGEEITNENVMYVSHYVCGACSCEIKAQNPGLDLPILMDWEGIFIDKEQAITMEQFISADTANMANSLDKRAEDGLKVSRKAMVVIFLAAGLVGLGGIALFLRSRLT